MTMFGASIKDGVLAFNQFSWGVEKLDVFGIALGVGLDIYDSIQRGVSLGGVVLGATLTTAKDVGLIYLDKRNYIWCNCNRKLFWTWWNSSRFFCW